ncbi:MAG: ABC transporter permease [Candidatus Saccharimonadales bacterium]
MFLAINEIMKEKSRFVLITAVIILVSYLVFFLTALAYGLASSYTDALDKWNASGIILSKDANDTVARSLLFASDYQDLLSDDVAPLGVGAATVVASEPEDVALFGIDTNSFLQPEVSSGRAIAVADEVVVSTKLNDIGVELGDTIKLQSTELEYRVVGFVDKATFQTAPVVYMTMDAWRKAASEVGGMTSMRDDTTVSALIARGEERSAYSSDKTSWQTISDFGFTLPGYRAQVLTFSLMIGFLIAIASFVLAIFIYILTMQKKSIFGVLKAEGVPSSYIGWSVMVQVIILSLAGLAIGMVGALLTGWLLASKVPFAVNELFFAGITLLFLICAALGGIASVRSVAKIDPVEAIG